MQVMQSAKALDHMLSLCQKTGGEAESKGSQSTVIQKWGQLTFQIQRPVSPSTERYFG